MNKSLENEINDISDFFNCSISSFYGHAERLIFAISDKKIVSDYKIERKYGL